MVEALLSIPKFFGCLVFSGITTAVGLTVYFATHFLVMRRQSDEAMTEIKEATSNLLRVIGWLFCLLLSLSFTTVVSELVLISSAIEGEATAIMDTHHNLRRFERDTTVIQGLLIDYAEAVIRNDWPALAEDRLSEQSDVALRQFEHALMSLRATDDSVEKLLLSRVVSDVDLMSDYRLSRLQQSQKEPPYVLMVVIVGFLATMSCFSVYRPHGALVGLMSLYTVFIGVVIYLIIAMSDPFEGTTLVDRAPLEYAVETMRAHAGSDDDLPYARLQFKRSVSAGQDSSTGASPSHYGRYDWMTPWPRPTEGRHDSHDRRGGG